MPRGELGRRRVGVRILFVLLSTSVSGDVSLKMRSAPCLADGRGPRAFSYVARGAGAPVRHPARRDRHGVVGGFIRLETTTALY
jgi:hypothetical protein